MNNTDNERFYKGNFIDEIVIINESDTSNIVIEQFQPLPYRKDSIAYVYEEKYTNSDLLILKMFVSFGSYSQTPKVVKEVNKNLDTLYIWYASRVKFNKSLYKTSSITEATTAPMLEYVTIDSIIIQKSKIKAVKLVSRYLKYQ